ncbi:COPS3 isoform 14 [Pan troglodytes]|uniref:COP9 signalosome subunit 3 n=3 Tax=Hominidae TaxID=9604 RepID=J3QS85_HUMAN|nr:COPS3 isoform 5 [Pan troglodytes]PNI17182.1 COPS3 isoform 14 [Pan troglodytes]PNJ08303.1 COPS3 isoform 4 [Pongo abelii]PNJ08306.1 COPS3 isoform 7 [Pongo abelii]
MASALEQFVNSVRQLSAQVLFLFSRANDTAL